MKPDGVTMETTEPTEAAAIAEPSIPQDNTTLSQPEESTGDATAANVNGKPAGAKAKTTTTMKKRLTSKTELASGSNSRPGVSPRRPVNDVKPTNNVAPRTAPVKKPLAPSAKPAGAAAVPKKTACVSSASTSTAKTQAKMSDKKPAGFALMAGTVTNGSKPVNGTPKKIVHATRPKTTAPISRLTSKPGTSASTKPNGATQAKTTRPATAPSSSRPAAKTITTASTTKPSTTSKPATVPPTAPSSGRTTASQLNKATALVKKDVTRPPSAAATRKPAPATTSAAARKPDVSKPAANVKPNTALKITKADANLPPLKPQQTIKPNATKKPALAAARFPALNRTAVSQTPPSSPAGKSSVSRSQAPTNTPRSKLLHKPTQAVSPLTAVNRTEKTSAQKATAAATLNASALTSSSEITDAGAAHAQETQMEANAALFQGSTPDTISSVAESGTILAQSTPFKIVQPETIQPENVHPETVQPETIQPENVHPETVQPETIQTVQPDIVERTASLLPQSPVGSSSAQTEQHQKSEPLTTLKVDPALVLSVAPPQPSANNVDLITDQTTSTSKLQQSEDKTISPINLNEEEEEEEKEGSQLVSVSEMSGTTQPTEESRPGSAGPIGASAWRVGGALLSELDSEEVSVSQQGASELSAPGVLEGTESMDDLGDGSLKGAMDMEGASAGSPDFERVPEIPVNDYFEDDDEEEDDNDRVCDMDVGSERTDEPQRLRHDNDVDEEDEDVEMASEGVTESGLESYGNPDEDDFAEDERLDNLNRVAQPLPPPPLLPSAPAAQWDQPNPFADHWEDAPLQQHPPKPDSELEQGAEAASASPLEDPYHADPETPTQAPAQAWMKLGSVLFANENQDLPQHSSGINIEQSQTNMEELCPTPEQPLSITLLCAPGASVSSIISSETSTSEEPNNRPSKKEVPQLSTHPEPTREHEAEIVPSADEVLGGSSNAPGSNPSSPSVTEDEASDTEGEAQLEDSLEPQLAPDISNCTFEIQPHGQRFLSTVEEGEEPEELESGAAEDATPPSATSQVSYGFDTMTTASNSNAQSTAESCVKSPGIFSLEELPEEAKEPGLTNLPLVQSSLSEQRYIECGKQEEVPGEEMVNLDSAFAQSPELQHTEHVQPQDDIQPPYYSAICEKTENSFAGFTALLHPQRRDHSSYPRSYCDIVKPVNAAFAAPKLSCADLPPRSPGQQPLSPQLRRLEQHQRHLQELQQRREQQSRPLEEAEQERKRREEEEQRKKKDEAEEEIKRNKEVTEQMLQKEAEEAKRREEEELKQRKDLELQLHQQQEELKQRQQIMQWQQELQQSNKGQTVVLSPSSGLCTIYEALENDEEEAKCEEETINELNSLQEMSQEASHNVDSGCAPERGTQTIHSPLPLEDHQQRRHSPTQNGDSSSPCPPESPERPPPLDLDWGKKVDIVHQLINQTLLLNGDGCSSLLLLPGGAGGTLSPLESSLWPSLLPPLTPPSATVTSVSSFSPETTGSSPQGEWTVVELETHH